MEPSADILIISADEALAEELNPWFERWKHQASTRTSLSAALRLIFHLNPSMVMVQRNFLTSAELVRLHCTCTIPRQERIALVEIGEGDEASWEGFDGVLAPCGDGHHLLLSPGRLLSLKKREMEWENARMRAEESSEFKNRFMSRMTHEIRSPMNGILGMAQILRETELDESQHDLLKILMQSSEALLNIVNNMTDLTRMEVGRFQLDQISFDLQACLEEVCEVYLPRAAQKKLELRCRYPLYPPPATPSGTWPKSGRWSVTCSPMPSSSPMRATSWFKFTT